MAKLLVRGAEADIYETNWFGDPAISKVRSPKSYRLELLDELLRRNRTYREAVQLHRAKIAGVRTPYVYLVDGKRSEILMEKVNGQRFKELLREQAISQNQLQELGIYLRRLHEGGMIHGDLTPSNFFLNSSSEIVLIDFGLSFMSDRREDRADDLHLLKTVLTAEFAPRGQEYFAKIVDGYASVTEKREMSLLASQIQSIERRGRYARVD